MKNLVNVSLANKVLAIANGGSELSSMQNFEVQIVRDGIPMVVRHQEPETEDGEAVPVTKYIQNNLHFSKLKNFTEQINSITKEYKDCHIQAGDFKVSFKGGRFAVNAEKLLKEITENYLRLETEQLIVDNESVQFEELQEKFTSSFVGKQTSILNYLALIDTFKSAKDSELQAIVKHLSFSEAGEIVFSDELTKLLTV